MAKKFLSDIQIHNIYTDEYFPLQSNKLYTTINGDIYYVSIIDSAAGYFYSSNWTEATLQTLTGLQRTISLTPQISGSSSTTILYNPVYTLDKTALTLTITSDSLTVSGPIHPVYTSINDIEVRTLYGKNWTTDDNQNIRYMYQIADEIMLYSSSDSSWGLRLSLNEISSSDKRIQCGGYGTQTIELYNTALNLSTLSGLENNLTISSNNLTISSDNLTLSNSAGEILCDNYGVWLSAKKDNATLRAIEVSKNTDNTGAQTIITGGLFNGSSLHTVTVNQSGFFYNNKQVAVVSDIPIPYNVELIGECNTEADSDNQFSGTAQFVCTLYGTGDTPPAITDLKKTSYPCAGTLYAEGNSIEYMICEFYSIGDQTGWIYYYKPSSGDANAIQSWPVKITQLKSKVQLY